MALWRYGTSCPFSHSRVPSGLPSRPANGWRPGPLTPPVGPLVRSVLRPELGPARRARSPASPLASTPRAAHAPTTQPPRGGRAGPGAGRGSGPPASPSSPRGLPGRLVSTLAPLLLNLHSELCWCISSCPLAVGCPLCPFLSETVFL